MQAKEKTYLLALATILLIGLSTAWAAYSATATITSGSVTEYATVDGSSPTLPSLKKNTWFTKTYTPVFTISGINVSSLYVRILWLNAPDLVDDFKSLTITVTLKKGNTLVDSGYLSLGTGTSEILLYADDIASTDTLYVDATVTGFTGPKASGPVEIQLACAVEPAVTS